MTPKPQGLLNWIAGSISTAFDTAREERIESHVARIDAEFSRMRERFSFAQSAAALGISDSDRPIVAERVYRRFLDRSWKDAAISVREAKLLEWVATTLELPPATVAALNAEAAGGVFKSLLAKAIADGHVDEAEAAKLQAIAEQAGQSVGELMAAFFEKEGSALLRNIFSQAAADGRLSREEWTAFRKTAERLGIPNNQMLVAIRQPAHELIEHVLADARSDGEISDREERVLVGLLDNIVNDQGFADYTREQIEEAKEMHRLAKGLLPSLPAPLGVALKAGEIVHWAGPVDYVQTRELASGTKTIAVGGEAVITDTRMILNALEKSFEVSHRKVLAHIPFSDRIEIRTSSKGAGRYFFGNKGEKAVVIWQAAIGRANQTIVASDDSQSRRRISREVRQRVWQRYGGRCAECSATTYLEFDHIIPVAKGGGNSDTNVQLLCRKCNLTKSDRI